MHSIASIRAISVAVIGSDESLNRGDRRRVSHWAPPPRTLVSQRWRSLAYVAVVCHRHDSIREMRADSELRCRVMQETRLDIARIQAARQVIDPIFLDTPLYRCEALEPDLGCAVSIKLETANPVRSFKARGAEVVASLLADNGSTAVVCASGGN